MRKLIASEWVSLDGVAQSPAYPDEDPSGGFRHGGWHLRFFEDVSNAWLVETIRGAGAFLLGRRTYEAFAAYWPGASEEERMLAEPLNGLPKHVASRTLKGSLPWNNASLLVGDAAAAVAALKRQKGGDLVLIGSTDLLRTLLAADLVDEFRLMIDPVVLGGGKRLFTDDGVLRTFRLLDGRTTSTGAVLATYARENANRAVR